MKKIIAVVLLIGAVVVYGGKLISSNWHPFDAKDDKPIEVVKDDDDGQGVLSVGGGSSTINS